MTRFGKWFSIVMILALVFVLSGCGNNSRDNVSSGSSNSGAATNNSNVEEKTNDDTIYEWDLMIYVGLSQMPGPIFVQFTDEVREKTNGRLDITVRPTGELPFKGDEALRVVSEGVVKIADANSGYISGDSKIAQLYNMPFLVTNTEEFLKTAEAIEPLIREDLARHGAEVLMLYNWPGQFFWGKGETVHNLSDLKGKKVRTYAPEQQVFLNELGAVPMSMVFDEVPGAVQRGVINALLTSGLSVYDNKMHEYLDWGFLARYNVACNYVIINSEALNELPDDLRQVLLDTAAKYQEILLDEMPNADASYFAEMEEAGMTIVDPGNTAAEEGAAMMASYWEQWAKDSGPEIEEALQKVRQALGK